MKLRHLLSALRRDTSGLALLEFALTTPLVLLVGGYGVELSNLALTNLRVSQIALNLADHASRVGLSSTLTTTQLRESDVNDVLEAARLEGSGIDLTTHGRVILSSLENVQQSYDSTPVQRIHWQRCIGLMSGTGYDSTYGTTSSTAGTVATSGYAGTAAPNGMGDTNYMVTAPSGSGLMFVEINYKYQNLFGSLFVGSKTIHYIASFIVRDKRDYSMIYNPSPAASRSTCNVYAT
ncbi:hypothetical protein HZF05_17600 [Sphingomonas sp. CGMCC 1.13654]|uniref:Uncharacterized protein n=1 Tax=Sphingomonas chungangi TaxID=2683589 RepID=A0A838LEL4_9SPHN|nr:hypothetical protein [Sphingomonas chungangi]MBA2935898.1 hypothetical protein [Sphingomonas chungangi]MVW54589.1 hypothetical protein [Sphingomonas chungangi]